MKLAFLFASGALACLAAPGNSELGSAVCAGCHKSIAATQFHTAMAQTWRVLPDPALLAGKPETHAEGPEPSIQYLIGRLATSPALQYRVELPQTPAQQFPVEVVMGGTRHGLSFLARVHDVQGSALPRAPLVETRFLHYAPEKRLELSPGFPREKPASDETALGRVLTPGFEEKCLTCHGQPRTVGTHRETGVGCESCHGPGQAHLAALSHPAGDKGILNPKRLPPAEQMRPCSQCHAGFSKVQDPMPDDLLISDQVTALSSSECFRQTGGKIACVNCHDPHQDAPRAVLVARTEKTCLGCHSQAATPHAALCPVNRTSGCAGCHMPDTRSSPPFVISDHWIRVHANGENAKLDANANPGWKSQITPLHLFLRIMVFDDVAKAAAVHNQLSAGTTFFDAARANSIDRSSAVNGGYLGDVAASEFDPAWAQTAMRLAPGENSAVVISGSKSFIVGRMPRSFREDAEARFNQAMELRKAGNSQNASAQLLEALKLYPRLLRALTYLGISYAESGNAQTGAAILRQAAFLYPQDAGAHFNLALADAALSNEDEIDEYKKTLAIDPDYVPAYLNWGATLYAKGRYDEAIDMYRQGIRVNPLVASLHYSLSIALDHQGKSAESQAELELARKINPNVAGGHS